MFFHLSKLVWFLAVPTNAALILATVGLVLAGRARPGLARAGRGLAWGGLGLLALAGFSPLGNLLALPLEERFPAWRDDGRPIAGVVVLGGAVRAEEGLARGQLALNEAGERVVALADLARRFPGARVLFSGGGASVTGEEVPEADGLTAFAATLGLAPDRVLAERESRNTEENARFSKAMLGPKPGERWLLVTSAWHMPRAVGCFRAAGFPVEAYPVDYRTRGWRDGAKGFSLASEGLRATDLMLKEWIGLAAYRLTGRTDALFPAP